MRLPNSDRHAPGGSLLLVAVAAVALAGCGPRHMAEMGPAHFSVQIREILAAEWSTPEYYDALTRLEEMGPEVDAVLVQLARDPAANTTARANALLLLADRNSPAALAILGRAILSEEIPRLRSAAVIGLNRLADTSALASSMIKTAVGDPARSVRLNALQALDIREVETLRAVLETDRDREVRAVARQLVAIAESRGAPLARDRRGALRTTGTEADPSIVFRPVRIESAAGYSTGDLRIELPSGPDIPLSATAEVLSRVIPAFFSPDRSRVVFEGGREIRVVDLTTRETISLGPGIAPRPIPFTPEFVFLREHEHGRVQDGDATRVHYWVYRSSFSGEPPELVGEMTATLRPEVRGNYSPARWMVVAETPDGFVLRGANISPFPLPSPVWRPDGAPAFEPALDPLDFFRGVAVKVGRLLLPAVRWDSETGFRDAWPAIDAALEAGVGGFILFGGDAESVRELTDELHRRAPHPLLVASDLERGAGQQFRGATPLPPTAALGALDDEETTRRAGELTAREARALGVNWIYAPVADVDLEPENPIIGTRAFGTDPAQVGRMVAAWVRGCSDGGALSCVKHFPGHGRTLGDSHIERPSVEASAEALEEDLRPFRDAVGAGTDSMMTAHVSYPALDPSGLPATLSAPILGGLLRNDLGFEGMIVTDALIMEGFIEDLDEGAAAVLAMNAGCDVLLYPQDLGAVIAALEAAIEAGTLAAARVTQAIGRIGEAAERVAGRTDDAWGREDDMRWALATAERTLQVVRGDPRLPEGPIRIEEVEDDLGGPYPPYPRTAFPAALQRAGVTLSESGSPLVVIYCDIRAWKGRPGLSEAARRRVRELMARDPEAPVILFSHPRLEAEIPDARHLLAAWGGEALMQEAAVARLTGRTGGLPTAASGLDR